MYEIANINGITFLFSPLANIETAALGVFFKVGSRYEASRVNGIAHFLEHLLFKGSQKYSYRKIKQEIEGRGGILNGFTAQEITAYYAQFLSKNLERTADILLDMVSAPLLKDTDIAKERKVILEEMKMYYDLPAARAAALIEQLLFDGHPLANEIIGSYDSVAAITKKDLNEFKRGHYLADNMLVCLTGAVKPSQIEHLINAVSLRLQGKVYTNLKAPKNLSGVKIKTETRNLNQCQLCLGFRGPAYLSKDRLALDLLHVVLGANMSSRLFEAVREKRALCYDISTEARKYWDCGGFIISLGLDKTQLSVALKSIIRELIKIKKQLVSQAELARAKDYLLGQLAFALERPQGRMFYLAENHLSLGRIVTFSKLKEKIAQINALDLKQLAQRIFDLDNFALAAVGNFDSKINAVIEKTVKQC